MKFGYNNLFIGASLREKEEKQGTIEYKSQVGPHARLHAKMTEIGKSELVPHYFNMF